MAKLTRVPAKVFAASAAATEIGQFGSAVAGSKLETADVATIQGLSAWLDGWSEALVSGNRYPALQEMNGLLKVLSYQGAYALQEGIPEYDSATTYYIGSIVKKTGTFELYGSLTNDNVGNALTVDTEWQFLIDLSNLAPVLNVNFALNSGYVNASGDADLLAGTTSTTLTFKVDDGTTYETLKVTYADKTQEVLTSLTSITGLSTDGSYTIIKEKDSNPVAVLSTTVTQDKVFEVSPADGDRHCLTATDLKTYKRVSGAWVETQYVPIGGCVVAGGVITSVSTNPYNDNSWINGRATLSSLGMPSEKYINLTLGSTGSTYTAPANGYYSMDCVVGSDGYIFFRNESNKLTSVSRSTNSSSAAGVFIPVKKGDKLIEYHSSTTVNYFRFIYAEGNKP